MHLTESGGSEAGKPWDLISGGFEPRSLTEVYAYAATGKARSPSVERRVDGTTSDSALEERR